MHINKNWFEFKRENIPDWQCPTCGGASLNLDPEDLRVYESGETARSQEEDGFDADNADYRFAATLHCKNNACREVITLVGSGKVEVDHIPGEKGWDTVYHQWLKPHFFQPSLIPISIPSNTPIDLKNSLIAAFAIIFANHAAAINQIRVAAEILLDEIGVASVRGGGGFLSLGDRISNHLHGDAESYKDKLDAIRWLGNDGSHGNGSISIIDLLNGLEIFESLLSEIYPEPKTDINDLARKVIEKKKLRRTLPQSHR
jgi:hypothetical protein